MSSVWMVHRESGQYSDWTYDVIGIFSSYESARKYIDSRKIGVCRDSGDTYWCERGWDCTDDMESNVAVLDTSDGLTFNYRVMGSSFSVFDWYGNDIGTFYITKYVLDVPMEPS